MQQEVDYTKRLDAGLWRRLLGYMRPYYKYLFAIMGTMAVSALCDTIFPLLTREAIDRFVGHPPTGALLGFGLRYGATVLLQSGCIFTFCILCGKAECGINRHIRKLCFHRLEELSFSYFDQTPVGFIISRMTSDTARLGETVAWGLVDLFWSAAYIVITAVAMFALNVKLALLVLSVMPVIAVVAVWFQKRILAGYRVVRKTNSQITGAFNEGITGAKTSKTLVREQASGEEFAALTGTMRTASIRAAVLSALFFPIVTTLGAVATAMVLGSGSRDVFSGVVTVGTLAAFVQYATGIFEPVSSIARIFADLQSTQAAAERVVSLLETEPEIFDTPEVVERFGDSFNPHRENWPDIRGDVEFDHVSFHYATGEEVLSDFSLKVKAGQTVALVGETGSGKSTIVNLISRTANVTGGAISWGGTDVRDMTLASYLRQVGIVPQKSYLFSGTLAQNLRYAKRDATDEELWEALRIAQASDFVEASEGQLEMQVSEGGSNYSGGQRQRLCIARAIVRKPRIFLFDDSFSALDYATDQKLRAELADVTKDAICLVVGQRIGSIKNAEQIVVMDEGHVAGIGTHEELLVSCEVYRQIVASQERGPEGR